MLRKSLQQTMVAPIVATLLFAACSPQSTSTSSESKALGSLSPFLTEMTLALGGEQPIATTVPYPHYSSAAAAIPLLSAEFSDHPWIASDGNIADEYGVDRDLVEIIPLDTFGDISQAIKRLGELTETQENAALLTRQYADEIRKLRDQYGYLRPVTVAFVLESDRLSAIAGVGLTQEAIKACGGINIFASIEAESTVSTVEAIAERKPSLVIRYQGTDIAQWDDLSLALSLTQHNVAELEPHSLVPSIEIGKGLRALCEKIHNIRLT